MRAQEDGLALRPVTQGDAPAIRSALEDEELQHWFPVETPVTDATALAYVRSGRHWHAILRLPDAEFLGVIGWRRVDQGNVQIFYWVTREARGQGVATGALRMLSGWALVRLRAPRVQLLVEPENRGSQRVAEKAGFRAEGVLRGYMDFNGARRDAIMFSLLPEDL